MQLAERLLPEVCQRCEEYMRVAVGGSEITIGVHGAFNWPSFDHCPYISSRIIYAEERKHTAYRTLSCTAYWLKGVRSTLASSA